MYEFFNCEETVWFVVVLFEVYVRILLNIFFSISNDILKISGVYKGRDCVEKHALFLDYCISFVCKFYFENVCLLLKSTSFLHMYNDFETNCDYSGEDFKVINDSYLQYCVTKFE